MKIIFKRFWLYFATPLQEKIVANAGTSYSLKSKLPQSIWTPEQLNLSILSYLWDENRQNIF